MLAAILLSLHLANVTREYLLARADGNKRNAHLRLKPHSVARLTMLEEVELLELHCKGFDRGDRRFDPIDCR